MARPKRMGGLWWRWTRTHIRSTGLRLGLDKIEQSNCKIWKQEFWCAHSKEEMAKRKSCVRNKKNSLFSNESVCSISKMGSLGKWCANLETPIGSYADLTQQDARVQNHIFRGFVCLCCMKFSPRRCPTKQIMQKAPVGGPHATCGAS